MDIPEDNNHNKNGDKNIETKDDENDYNYQNQKQSSINNNHSKNKDKNIETKDNVNDNNGQN